MMRRYLSIVGVFALLALPSWLSAGCDSSDDDGPTDAERFVGTWVATGIEDSAGDQSAEFVALVNSLVVVMEAGDTPAFRLTVDYKDDSGRADENLDGTYAVDDGPRHLTLTISTDAPTGANLPFTYVFQSDSQVALSAPAALVNPVFNPTTPYEGTVTVNIQKQ